MIDQILALIHLKKELPDAVGYQLLGPVGFTLPDELLAKLDSPYKEEFIYIKTSYLIIDNFSNRVQKNIRIIYSGDIGLEPDAEYQDRNSKIEFEHKKDIQEIHIKEILPEESVVISITNAASEFSVKRILISDAMITTTMKKLAKAKRSPSFLWLYILTTLLIAGTIFTTTYIHQNLEENHIIAERMDSFYKRMGYSACQPEIFHNEISKEKELERLFNQLDDANKYNTLKFNNAETYEQLKHLEKIIFCKFTPNKSANSPHHLKN